MEWMLYAGVMSTGPVIRGHPAAWAANTRPATKRASAAMRRTIALGVCVEAISEPSEGERR
jgi:hypothetical protein